MFETLDNTEILGARLFNPNQRTWPYIHRRLHTRWFHVEFEDPGDVECGREILFLTTIEQLLDLRSSPNCRIVELELVSPGHLNKQGRWRMELLKEIWSGFDPALEREATIFVLKNGSRYMEYASVPEEMLQNKRRIFVMPECQSPSQSRN